MLPGRLNRQRGIALLMAMLVVALATVTAVSLVHDQAISMRKTGHVQASDAALQYALALEDFARVLLREDRKDSNIDHLGEIWAKAEGVTAPIEGGLLNGSIRDAQARFNLNSVLEQENEDRLRVLCNNLQVSPEFIPALKDWIDDNLETEHADGAEDDYYTALEQPYRTANRELVDVSELLLVKGMTFEMFEKLQPYVTALPAAARLNINTMAPEIYAALDNNLNPEKFETEREQNAFQSLEDYKTRMEHPALIEAGLSVSTEYFVAQGHVLRGDKALSFTSLIHRDEQGATNLLWRHLGGI
jgi:general secretion pathway protein K